MDHGDLGFSVGSVFDSVHESGLFTVANTVMIDHVTPVVHIYNIFYYK